MFSDNLEVSLVSAASAAAVMEELSTWSSIDRLGAVDVPALVIAGRRDVFCSTPQLRRIVRALPAATFVELDTGHMVWNQDAEGFFSIVTEWLQAHAA